MRVLVLAPHTDDGELGCGATISKLISAGHIVEYVAFSHVYTYGEGNKNTLDLLSECLAATGKLGIDHDHVHFHDFEARNFAQNRQQILDIMVKLHNDFKPSLVFVPMTCDVHQDHQVITAEATRAFKNCSLLGYEMVWNNLRPTLNVFIPVTEQEVTLKIKAFLKYQSQKNRPYYQNVRLLEALARTRGLQAECPFAEAFECIKIVKDLLPT